MSQGNNRDRYILDNGVKVAELKAKEAFDKLTQNEKLYAYHLARASWEGAKICLLQCSVESVPIFTLLRIVYEHGPTKVMAKADELGFTEDEKEAFNTYAATFFANMGNYKSFGDTKFAPNLAKEKFTELCTAFVKDNEMLDEKLTSLLLHGGYIDLAYDIDTPHFRQLGMTPNQGVSSYYSSDMTEDDLTIVHEFMKKHSISPYNTRVFKMHNNGETSFELRLASMEGELNHGIDIASITPIGADKEEEAMGDIESAEANHAIHPKEGNYTYEGRIIVVRCGDYAPMMARVVKHLRSARQYAANDTQRQMLTSYVKAFRTGSTPAHMYGSKQWVKDKGPVVESYIGFIETYRDPMGVRAEWEGFVAIVNKEMSAKFTDLVEHAPDLLKLLPWSNHYEKDEFLRPDFTSLEIIGFGSSMLPAGINIPNYDHVRQDFGFKNVSLGNVLSARSFEERVTFLQDSDQENFKQYIGPSFEVQVGLHELLGHGSGKLLSQQTEDKFNFDKDAVVGIDDGPVSSWYRPGQTWDNVFSDIASSYEECRAECVGIYLCPQDNVLKIFGHDPASQQAQDLVYINWLNMARAGLMALMFYNPDTKAWLQAHMQARFAILRVMLEAEQGFCEIRGFDHTGASIQFTVDDVASDKVKEGENGVHVYLDRSKIKSVGVPAVGEFLRKLQVYKSTADYENGKKIYENYTSVPEHWLALRDLVFAKRKPRPVFVQPSLVLESNDDVSCQTFDASLSGVAESYVSLFPQAVDDDLMKIWQREASFHQQ